MLVGLFLGLLFLDLAGSLVRLRVSGIKKGIASILFDKGYRKSTPGITKPNREKTILVIGDSIGVAPGAEPEETLSAQLAELYNMNVVNIARNGLCTRDVLHQIDSVKGQRFALVMVHTGNNDIWRFTNLKHLRKDIELLLDKVKEVGDQVILFRGGDIGNCPFFPYFFAYLCSRRSKRIRELFMPIAKQKDILYVEKFMSRKDDIFLKKPYYFYCWDLLHLNGNGYRVWFDFLVEELKKNNIVL